MTLDEQDEIARPFGGSHEQTQGAGDASISEDDGDSFKSSESESNPDEINVSNDFSELQKQLMEFKVELEKKKTEIKKLNEEKAKLENRLEKMQEQNSQLKTKVEALEKEKDGLIRQINQLIDEITLLKEERDNLKVEIVQLQKEINKLDKNLKQAYNSIEEQKIEIRKLERENHRLKTKIELQQLLIILCIILGIATVVFGVLFANYARLNDNKKREIVRLEQQRDSLQKIVEISPTATNDEENSSLNDTIKAKQKEINTLKEEIKVLKDQSPSERITELQQQLINSNNRISSLEIQVDQKDARMGELSANQKNTETQLTKANNRIDILENQVNQKDVRIGELTNNLKGVETQLSKANSKIGSLENQVDQKDKTIKALQDENEKLKKVIKPK